jgi:hypothetical protein
MCVTIINSSGLRNSALTLGSDDGAGDGGWATVIADALCRYMTNFGQLTGFLQSAGVRSFLVVMASAVVLSGCAANQQTASTSISPQEEQDRSVCLQHAHRDSGFNEKAFTSCMTAKGYKKDKLYPSVTIADAGSPSLSDTLSDTWKKMVQAVSPDNAARQPDSENAGQARTENTTQPPSPAAAPQEPR